MFELCAVIPVYNHGAAISDVVAGLRRCGLPVFLVDDASEPGCAAILEQLAHAEPEVVFLERHAQNQGKGGAVLTGMHAAARHGFTHVLQIDADGQHELGDVPQFVAQARAHPDSVICGHPLYDASVPRHRLYGRYATHIWVWINTLSLRITDSMCGFRIYPLAAVMPLLQKVRIARRMDFDTDILVRLDWLGVPIINQPTRVTYPKDGVSHFRAFLDNVAITRMHTRLFFGMLPRSPRLLWRHLNPKRRAP